MSQQTKRNQTASKIPAMIATGSFTITNPLTGKPVEKTPTGMSLDGVTFQNRDDAWKFICEHWENPVELREFR